MNPALLGVFVILLIVGLVLKVPFGVTVGGAALTTLLIAGTDVREVPQVATVALDSFPLLAIPGFVLAGMLMARGGCPRPSCGSPRRSWGICGAASGPSR